MTHEDGAWYPLQDGLSSGVARAANGFERERDCQFNIG